MIYVKVRFKSGREQIVGLDPEYTNFQDAMRKYLTGDFTVGLDYAINVKEIEYVEVIKS